MDWAEAMAVLADWVGREVIVVPYLGPGMSLLQMRGTLELRQPRAGMVQLPFAEMTIALPRATFIAAEWVPGREDQGLSITQGGVRVDVFVDDD